MRIIHNSLTKPSFQIDTWERAIQADATLEEGDIREFVKMVNANVHQCFCIDGNEIRNRG